MIGYTIVSRAYVPQARVLARSFTRHHPGAEFWALLIDDLHHEIVEADEPFHVLRLASLDMDRAELHRMAMLFGNRLIAAIKPWVFEHFLARGADAVLYIDSDFVIYDTLDHVGEAAVAHGVVVVPHVLTPVPHDEHLPDETLILGVGTFNAGFFAVGTGSGAFTGFLKERLRRECHTDVAGMRVNEQRWLDFVPALFDHVVLRDLGVDVAPWNIHERHLTRLDDHLFAGDSPLRAFHFSGFDPRVSSVLSARDYWELPRVPMAAEPVLIELCEQYRNALYEAGFEEAYQKPFAFDFLADGRPIYATLRPLYADALTQAEASGREPPPDPFDVESSDAFASWMVQAYAAVGLEVPVRLRSAAVRELGPARAVDDWLGRMKIGTAGRKQPPGVVRFDPDTTGFVVLGPYAQLGAGRYRATVELRFPNPSPEGGETGTPPTVEVVLDGYVLLHSQIDRMRQEPTVVEFSVSDRLEQSSLSAGVELRIFSHEIIDAVIEGVLVERIGDADTAHVDRFEWLSAMIPGDAAVRQGASIAQVPGQLGFVAFGPHWRLEAGRYRAELRLETLADDPTDPSTVLALVEAVTNNHVLAHHAIDRQELTGGHAVLDFDIGAPWTGLRTAQTELRLRAGAEAALVLHQVSIERIGDAGTVLSTNEPVDWLPAMWVSDIGTRIGTQIHATSGQPGILAYGPHWQLEPGSYRVTMVIGSTGAADGLSPSAVVASIEVVVDGRVVVERSVPVSALAATPDSALGGAHVLDFEVEPSSARSRDVEFRVSVTGQQTVALRSAVVRARDPR